MPVASPNLSFLFNCVRMILRSAGPFLVEFGITSEAGPYYSLPCSCELQKQGWRSDRRHHWWGNTAEWIFHSLSVVPAVMKERAVGPWRKTGGNHLILLLSHSVPALQNSIVFLLPKKTVYGDRPHSCLRLWKGKERIGKEGTQTKKVRTLKHMKGRQIKYDSSLVLKQHICQ